MGSLIQFSVDRNTLTTQVADTLPAASSFSFSLYGSMDICNDYSIRLDELYLWSRKLCSNESIALNLIYGYLYPFQSWPIFSDFRVVSGVSLTDSGEYYTQSPTVTISAPVSGGITASGIAIMTPDTGKIYADSYPAFSVGNTNNIISTLMSGSGFFTIGNNDFLRVGYVIKTNDWAAFLNFSATGYRPTGVSMVLLSTMSSTNQTSGLIFGINDVNRLFFEYIDTTHPSGGVRRRFTQNQELSENNIVSISADSVHQTISICNHNIAKGTSFGKTYLAQGYQAGNEMHLFGFRNIGNDARYTGFFGVARDVLVLDMAANPTQLNAIAPLFCLTGYVPESKIPYYVYTPVITGASFSQKVIATGVTGYQLELLSIPDKDGSNISAFDIQPLSGEIWGSGIQYQQGTDSGMSVSYSGVPEELFYDDTAVRFFADSNFVMLNYSLLSGDLTEVYAFTDKWEGKMSVMPEAFNINDFYLSSDFAANNANVYHNGLLQITGVDYVITSGKIVSSGFGDYKSIYSYLIYDEISGTTMTSGWTGWNGQYILSGNPTSNGLYDIYLDGQKFASGVDFVMSGTNVVLTGTQFGYPVSWSSGLFAFPPVRTGNRNVFTGTGIGYWHDFSVTLGRMMDEMIFVNGQRLAPDVDYKTTSPASLLNSDNRPGGWSPFWVYTGDAFATGIVSRAPSYTSGVSDAAVSKAPPVPI